MMELQELLEAAYEAQPEKMEKVAHHLALLERLDPAGVPEVLADFHTITDVTLEKSAAAGGGVGWKGFGAAVGGTLLSGLAAAVASDLYDASKRGLAKGGNFKAIMRENPELRELDPKRVRVAFDMVHRYSPEFTADPTLGGSLVKTIAGLEGNEYTLVKDLLGSRKNLREAKDRQFKPGTPFLLGEKDKGPDTLALKREELGARKDEAANRFLRDIAMKQYERQLRHDPKAAPPSDPAKK